MNPFRAASALLVSLTVLTAYAAPTATPLSAVVRDDLQFAVAQYTGLLARLDGTKEPQSWDKGALVTTTAANWTSGFFPGSLWYLYEATGDPRWRDAAEKYTALLEPAKNNRGTHDVGFILNCSFGNGLRLTGNPHYRDVLLTGAASLSTRFNPTVGAIKSWDKERWRFPVIIDNLMNLELLCWASQAADTPRYEQIAVAHADTTLRTHMRPNGGSYHVVDFDPTTGAVVSRGTHQGAADESTWARGEAWGLYGYTMMYRETKHPGYLAEAEKIAAFVIHHPRLPADKVPYWDFDAPHIPNEPRDSSAAAIMCSALLELARYAPAVQAGEYREFAFTQLRSLSSAAYRAPLGGNGGFLLMHATANYPQHSQIDVPITYADYYWLEALIRARADAGSPLKPDSTFNVQGSTLSRQ